MSINLDLGSGLDLHGELRFLKGHSPTANYVGFKGPASLSASMVWTLPSVDGSNGHVLKTNGSGTLIFGSVDWNDLTNKPGAFTPLSHVLATTSGLGSEHSVSGLTAGQVLRATGSTTAAFGALQASDIPSLDAGKIGSGTLSIARGGTGQSTASAALNALLPSQTGHSGKFLTTDGTNASWATVSGGGSGTVTSVGLSAPSQFSVGSAVTTSGNLSFSWQPQSANLVLASPNGSSGTPTFRALAAADIPALDTSKLTSGILTQARGGLGSSISAFAQYSLISQGVSGGVAAIAPNTNSDTRFLKQVGPSGNAPVWSLLSASDIPSLDASKITTGTLAANRGGTGADTSSFLEGNLAVYGAGGVLTQPNTTLAYLSWNQTLGRLYTYRLQLGNEPGGNSTTPAPILVHYNDGLTGGVRVRGFTDFSWDVGNGFLILKGIKIIPGSGSPEGAVDAPVGSLYLRADGGTGTTLYIKESGSGTTGWVAK